MKQTNLHYITVEKWFQRKITKVLRCSLTPTLKSWKPITQIDEPENKRENIY